MKKGNLSSADRARIRALSRGDVEITLSQLGPFLSGARWVAKTNRYSSNTTRRIGKDLHKIGALQRPKDLSHYIAASCPLHCADGWSYFGKALISLLRGDPHRVVHLAYYAELRAAISLLASEGIGIFNQRHFVVDAPRSVAVLGDRARTHEFAWGCLKFWSRLSRSGTLFASLVEPGGVTLAEWFDPVGGVGQISAQARQWFGQWSMDIGLFVKDREARNDSSYRPDGIPRAWNLNSSDVLSLVSEIWECFEPSSTSPFANLDRYILRIALEGAFTGRTGKTPLTDPAAFEAFVLSVVRGQSFEGGVADHWTDFLLRRTVPVDPKLFAYSRLNPTDADGYAAVLARAALLLRVASGSACQLFRAAGISSTQISFWWEELGMVRGLWPGKKTRTELFDMWEDISLHLEKIRDFQNQHQQSAQSFYRVGTDLADVVMGLGGSERVAIWSLVP